MKKNDVNSVIETIMDETPNIIILKDYNGRFVFGNKKLADLYGTTTKNLIGKSDEDFNPNKQQTDFFLHNIQKIMDKGELDVVIEKSTDIHTSETHYYHSVKKPFTDEHGNKFILVIANDITDIQKSKLEVEEKKERLDLALDIIGEGVWDWDLSQNLVKHNSYWCKMFGFEDNKKEHSIEFFSSIIYEDDQEKVKSRLEHALEQKIEFFSKHRMVCADGTLKWVEDRGKIIQFDNQGNPLRMLGSVKDITDKIRLEEQEKILEKQTRLAALGEMIGNISHQWRQPLSVINSMVTSLELHQSMGKLDDKSLHTTVEAVSSQVMYLSQTIDDFRNFIKNDRKDNHFYITMMLKKTLSLVNAVIVKNFIKVHVDYEDDAKCMGFESEVLQAVINIVNNAKDAFVDNNIDEVERYIKINSLRNGKNIEIHIIDSAGGISQDYIDRIFDPYFTTKDDERGTGLGLHMSKKIVEDSYGTIHATNSEFEIDDKIYRGAHFILSFPIIEE